MAEAALLLSARPRRRPGTGSPRRRATRCAPAPANVAPRASSAGREASTLGGDRVLAACRRASPPQTRRPNAPPSTIESSTPSGRAPSSARIAPRIERSRPRTPSPRRRPRSDFLRPAAVIHRHVARRGRRRCPCPSTRSPVEVEALEREAAAGEVEVQVPTTIGVSGCGATIRQRGSVGVNGLRRRRVQAVGGRRAGSRRRGARRRVDRAQARAERPRPS